MKVDLKFLRDQGKFEQEYDYLKTFYYDIEKLFTSVMRMVS